LVQLQFLQLILRSYDKTSHVVDGEEIRCLRRWSGLK
jgi:hypothetical protein